MADYVVVDKEQLESDLTTVADAIRDKFELTEKLEFPDGMSEAIKTVLQGTASGGDDFLQYTTNTRNLFQKAVFPENYTITLNLPKLKEDASLLYMFSESNICKIVLRGNNASYPLSLSYFCNLCIYLEEVDISDFNFVARESTYMFGSCFKLKRIIGEIDFSEGTNIGYAFNACTNLEEVRFKKETIPSSIRVQSSLLSDASIQSIIDGLADLTGAETQTLIFHADVKAKLTEEQITTITSKNWTLA